jgi:hypothetical protein
MNMKRLVSLIIVCVFLTVHGSAALYDGFNYVRDTYDAESSADLPWKGEYGITHSSLMYCNIGVLDTSGHMMILTNGMSATRNIGNELQEIIKSAAETKSPVFMSFICKINAGNEFKEPFLFVQDSGDTPLITVSCSNGVYLCEYGKKSGEIVTLTSGEHFTDEGSMVCLEIDAGNDTYSTFLTVNPMLGMEIAKDPAAVRNAKDTSGAFKPESIRITAPKDTEVWFDELRIGCAPKEIGFKYTTDDQYVQKEEEPSKEIDTPSLKNIVIIKGTEGTGTGFVVKEGTNIYVYSNLHILTGNRGIKILDNNGTQYKVKKIECASDRDLVRITLKRQLRSYLTIAEKLNINEPISVCGNAGGEGVVRPVFGKVLGVGPEKIETDAGFIPGHSGSPMVNSDNQVMGIASYISIPTTNVLNQDTPFTETRRIGYRVDNVPGWIPVSASWFMKESQKLKEHENNIFAVLAVVAAWAQDPILTKLPQDDRLPRQLNSWIADHNIWVSKNMGRYSRRSLSRGFSPTLSKELLNDIERLEARINVLFAEKPLRWHLPQFKEEWEKLEKYEQVVSQVMSYFKELCK